ncbi:LapA family protein [Streptomyces sp. NPDC096079]|uniref:LapA family protein n=1 Tax=unclassified Streptomyces TaxID=2593676 RepID=UPI003321A283
MARNAVRDHPRSSLTVKGRDIRLRTLGFLVLAALAIWFIAVNTGSVTIRLWVPEVTLPLWVVLTCTLLAGVILGMLIAYRRAARR